MVGLREATLSWQAASAVQAAATTWTFIIQSLSPRRPATLVGSGSHYLEGGMVCSPPIDPFHCIHSGLTAVVDILLIYP